MTKKHVRWGTAVPLIGGMSVAARNVTGADPEMLFSYSPFAENEKNVKAYFSATPHYTLDLPDHGFDPVKYQGMDFINALCPCAGLSLLSSGSMEQRDGMNAWMLKTAAFVTSELKPKVFWGENAPGLYTSAGARVRDQFRKIADDNGYSFSIYATNTKYHGIPQDRKRTFYFFWKDSNVPLFEYYDRPVKSLTEYLQEVPANVPHHQAEDLQEAARHLLTNPYIMFLQQKYNNEGINDMRKWLVTTGRKGFTLLTYLLLTEQLEEAQQWMEANGHKKHAAEALRVIKKVGAKGTVKEDGTIASGGFWDGSFPIYRGDGNFATLISRTLYAIHPTEDRVLTPRECMHLMGLPNDFKLASDNLNAICQNVPTCTGGDMAREVMAFINGERTLSSSQFLMQSNHAKKVDVQQSSLLGY